MQPFTERRGPAPVLTEIGPAAFGRELDTLMAVYAAAMHVPAIQLPGRRAIMEMHAVNPAFRAIVVLTPPPSSPDSPPAGTVAAFAYGFHGGRGQWWHDLVRTALLASYGPSAATAWLSDSFEVAEVHVHPDYQQRGIGRRMVTQLTQGRTETTAVLSTMDTESVARRLYRSLGFTDLLTRYRFGGATEDYAVMGARLPLRGAAPTAAVSPG